MLKEMEHFAERPSGSCSSAALCMTLRHVGVEGVDETTLREMHERVKAKHGNGELFSKLAIEARWYGLDTELLHSAEELFSNDAHLLPDETFDALVAEYTQALEQAVALGAKSLQGVSIDTAALRTYLDDGYVIMLAGQRSDGSLHTVLVNGYDGDLLLYHDPDEPKVTKETQSGEPEAFSKTGVGSWLLAVRKDRRMINRLTDSLDEFNEKAREYLKKSQ